MTAMRTITVTLPEHIVAAAEADVAAGDAVSLDAWIAAELLVQRLDPTLIKLAKERLEAIYAGDDALLTLEDLEIFLSEQQAARGKR